MADHQGAGSNGQKITITHERGPNYRTELVSGFSAIGPMGDGMYRLALFRDALPLVHEVYDADPDNPAQIRPGTQALPIHVAMIREDVVTLILPTPLLRQLANDMARLADSAEGVAGAGVSEA